MSQKTLKFNKASDVLEYLDQNHLTDEERNYYFSKLRASGGFEGISFLNKESTKEIEIIDEVIV